MKQQNQSSENMFGLTRLDFDAVERAHARARQLRSEAFHRTVLAPMGRAARRLLEALRAHFREESTVRNLSALSDRTLKDIGVHRCEIRRLAAELARPPRSTTALESAEPEVVGAPGRAANDDDARWKTAG